MTGPKRVTEKQLAANRRNAQRSTGPRTLEGKAVSRYNALKHGILAQAIIPEPLEIHESRQAFEELLHALREECAPATALEEMMVERIATAYWRLARLYRAEGGVIAGRQEQRESDMACSDAQARALATLTGSAAPLEQLLQKAISHLTRALEDPQRLRRLMMEEDAHWRDAPGDELRAAAQKRLAQLQTELRQRHEHKLAVEEAQRAMPSINTALKYARYETALQGQLERALNRLERLQRRRQADGPSPMVDLNVNLND